MTPTIRSVAIATAICPASISWAIFSGVVRDVPAVQSPSSATAYTRFTSDASSLTSEVSAAASAGAFRTVIMSTNLLIEGLQTDMLVAGPIEASDVETSGQHQLLC